MSRIVRRAGGHPLATASALALALTFGCLAPLSPLPLAGPAHAQNAATLNGNIVFWRTSRIATPVTGRIAALPKRVGDPVKKGEVLAEIDTQQLRADLAIASSALANARASLVSAEARLAQETTEYDRIAKLRSSPAFSGARFEDLTNRVAVAKAEVATAQSLIATREAEVARRELDIRLATIEAAFDGVVVRHLLTVGGLVSTEDPHILVVVDTSTPEVEVAVPADKVVLFPAGRDIDVSVGGKRELAKVRSVMPAETPGAKTRLVRLDLSGSGARYTDTEPVAVYLPSS